MFSLPVEVVADTRIFARLEGAEQILVYSMSFRADSELAMILPLPTPPASKDDAVTFLDFSECPSFFDELGRYFVVETMLSFGDEDLGGAAVSAGPPLVVHDVGSFEASFVRDIPSFRRLDPRFRLSDAVWSHLPQYEDFGFAVFKLKSGRRQRIHPMALRFPTRDPGRLFYPTLHVHDGNVAREAHFDHALYCQGTLRESSSWERSSGPIEDRGAELTPETTRGAVSFGEPAWKLAITGRRKNEDVVVPTA